MGDSPMFFCGSGGCVPEMPNEFMEQGRDMARELAREYRKGTGEYPPMSLQIDWTLECAEAARRRLTMKEYEAVKAAQLLLERHGFAVEEKGNGIPEGEA